MCDPAVNGGKCAPRAGLNSNVWMPWACQVMAWRRASSFLISVIGGGEQKRGQAPFFEAVLQALLCRGRRLPVEIARFHLEHRPGGIEDDAHRVAAFLHDLDLLLHEAPEHDHAAVAG